MNAQFTPPAGKGEPVTDMSDDDLLQLVRQGLSDADIGRALAVSPADAAGRVRAALERRGLCSRAEAVISGVLLHGIPSRSA